MSTQAIQTGEAFVNLNVRGDAVQKARTNIGDKMMILVPKLSVRFRLFEAYRGC